MNPSIGHVAAVQLPPPAIPAHLLPSHVKTDVYDLHQQGRVQVQYPEKLDAESIKEVEEFFALIVRKMRRQSSVTEAKS